MKKKKEVLLSLNFHPGLSKYYNLYDKNKIIQKNDFNVYVHIFSPLRPSLPISRPTALKQANHSGYSRY